MSPINLVDDTSHRSGVDEEHLKEIVLAFGTEELEVLLRQVSDTIRDRIDQQRKKA